MDKKINDYPVASFDAIATPESVHVSSREITSARGNLHRLSTSSSMSHFADYIEPLESWG